MEDIKELDKIADIKEEDLTDEKIISSFSGEVLDAAKAYLLSLKAYKLLSYEETTKLFTKYKATHSKKIRNKLIEHNLRLVVSVVNSVGRPNNTMDFLDLIQEGNIGLMKAIDRYDVSLGYRFSTYATYWIKQAIGRSLDNYGSTIRIPVHLKSLFFKYLKYKDQYQKNNGCNPKEEQIKKELNINDSRYKALLHVENNVGQLSSLNSFVSDDSNSSELGDFVADTKKDAYNDSINMMDDLSLMYSLKESLPKRLYYILYYRVFIEEKQTLEEISQRLGITRERIRQLDKGALAKAKIIIKKPRKIRKNLTYKDVLPEPVEKYVILGYLKKHLEPYKYYIFYQKWFLHENFYSMFSYENANYANQIYDEISEEYRDLLNYGASAYAKAVQEALETKKPSELFDIDISPLEYSNVYFMMENTDKDAILDILKEECLDDDKRINDFFDTSLKTIHPSQVDRVLKKLNIHHYGYQYKKDTIPLEKLYDTYLQNIDEFSPSLKEKLEGTIFQTFTNKKYDTSDEKLGRMINYSIGRLEAMYYNIDNYFKYELTLEALEKVLNNDKNDLTVEARKLLRERYMEGITIKELAKKYGVSYIKMHDDLRKHYDHAIALSFNKSVKLVITDEERYKKYILDKRYPIASTSRDVCYLFFIKHKNYKEIAEILNIDNTAKVSNFLTEAIRKMDFWYYGIIKENVFPLDKVNEVLNNIEYDSLTMNIIKESFINGLANDEIAQKLGVDLDTVDFATSEFITQYNDYHSRIDLSMDDIIKEINLPLCDSVLTNSEREFLSFYFGIKNAYNPEKKIDRVSSTTNDVEEYKEQLLTKVREHICGLLIPDFSIYSQAEIKEILNNPLIPISDYEKDLLRDIKGLDGFFYTQTELAKKYNVTKAYSIGRRINRALLTIKKYEAGEIEGKIDYDVHVAPLLKYFPLFEQKILYKRFKEKKTSKQIGKMYKLTETQSLDLVGKIEKRFYYLLKFPNAKKFDFDYARTVLHNDDLPFYGDKAKAIHLYERLFGDDGEFPQIKEELLDELNITKNAPTSLHIKYLMIAVMKYKDGIKKNKTFTKEEIEDFYTRNKDQYNELEQKTFEKTLNKFADAVNLPIIDVYNEFVTYELLKEREKELFYNKETPKDTIRNIILNNPCNLSHSQLEVLRNYFKLTKRDLLSGKEKIKLIKLLYPALIEYDLKIQKKHKKNSIDEINLARQIDTEAIEVKEDLDNNVKYMIPYIITPKEFENNKVLVATEDLDYVFAYIYNYIKSIDVLKRNELLERLYALKAYILNNLDRFVYQDVFKNGLNSKNMEKLKNMPPELKAFFTELMRLKNCNIKQDIADAPSTYLRKTLMSNEKYFRRVQIRGKDAKVNFINSLNNYYKEINLGKITKDNYQELTKRVIDAYREYLVDEGSLISYFSDDDIELIEELFGDIDHEEIDIRGRSYDKEPVGKLVRVKKNF